MMDSSPRCSAPRTPPATAGAASTFDELVCRFTADAQTLSDAAKLDVLKRSAETLEELESEPVRRSVGDANRARERGLLAAARQRLAREKARGGRQSRTLDTKATESLAAPPLSAGPVILLDHYPEPVRTRAGPAVTSTVPPPVLPTAPVSAPLDEAAGRRGRTASARDGRPSAGVTEGRADASRARRVAATRRGRAVSAASAGRLTRPPPATASSPSGKRSGSLAEAGPAGGGDCSHAEPSNWSASAAVLHVDTRLLRRLGQWTPWAPCGRRSSQARRAPPPPPLSLAVVAAAPGDGSGPMAANTAERRRDAARRSRSRPTRRRCSGAAPAAAATAAATATVVAAKSPDALQDPPPQVRPSLQLSSSQTDGMAGKRRAVQALVQAHISALEGAKKEGHDPGAAAGQHRVENLERYPDVRHARRLVRMNASSAFNWLMLAQAMSAHELHPPYCVHVTYAPLENEEALGDMEGESVRTATDADGGEPQRSAWMTMRHVLVRALSCDNENQSAWEGLALLLPHGERCIVLRDRTRRPMSVTNIDCYTRLLRLEPSFYGWVGLGCAMVEEAALSTDTPDATSPPSRCRDGSGVSRRRRLPGAARASSPAEPVRYSVLYGRRPYEAKDCFARAAAICPWEPTVWVHLVGVMATGGGRGPERVANAATTKVEVDPPLDERELVETLRQREALRGTLPQSVGGPTPPAAAAARVEKRLRALGARMLQAEKVGAVGAAAGGGSACELSFAEVASVALELNPANASLWRTVGRCLASRPRAHSAAPGSRKLSTTADAKSELLRSPAGAAAAAAAAAAPTHVYVWGTPMSAGMCLRRAAALETAPASAPTACTRITAHP